MRTQKEKDYFAAIKRELEEEIYRHTEEPIKKPKKKWWNIHLKEDYLDIFFLILVLTAFLALVWGIAEMYQLVPHYFYED